VQKYHSVALTGAANSVKRRARRLYCCRYSGGSFCVVGTSYQINETVLSSGYYERNHL
jgi:hypothetical protein